MSDELNFQWEERQKKLHRKRLRKNLISIFALCAATLLVLGIFWHVFGEAEPNSDPDPSTEGAESTEGSETTEETATDRSLLDFLRIAVQPVGNTMYVWGGGWNEEDTGAGIEAVTIGVSSRWAEFAETQNSSYNYHDTEYQIHDGLDCSGYVGWAVYNVLENENGKDGYVLSAAKMAQNYADREFGEYIPTEELTRWIPGDIMSMDGHVWIVVGMCDDGSVLFLHASPPGVIFCGTNLADGSKSQAVLLAEEIMSTHYPDWYAKFPNCSRSYTYLTRSWAMRWSRDTLSDDEGLSELSASEIVDLIYG